MTNAKKARLEAAIAAMKELWTTAEVAVVIAALADHWDFENTRDAQHPTTHAIVHMRALVKSQQPVRTR